MTVVNKQRIIVNKLHVYVNSELKEIKYKIAFFNAVVHNDFVSA